MNIKNGRMVENCMNIGNISSGEIRPFPPLKPARGTPRTVPIKIEPLKEQVNLPKANVCGDSVVSPVCSKSQFRATEKYFKMKEYFRRSISIIRRTGEFSGNEGANILDEYLRSHSDQFSNQVINRENAIKVLDMWMQQNVIRPLQSLPVDSPQFYMDSKKVFYIMNRDEDHKMCLFSSPCNPPTKDQHKEKKTLRSNSFTRFFSPSRLKRSDSAKGGEKTSITRLDSNASNHSRSRSSTFGIFSFGGSDSEALKDDALLYEAALFRLLTIVEVPVLDELTIPLGKGEKSVSFLSTILAKMGIGDSEVHLWKDDEMDDLLQSSLFLRPVLPWFQLARVCAPSLYFKHAEQKQTDAMQAHLWAKQSLQAVVDRYSSLTRNGESPLIPNEFVPILDAISQQLLGNEEKKEKVQLALKYLWLMIPEALRVHLGNVLHFLEWTIGTEQFISLRSPYFLGKRGSGGIENFELVLNKLRIFIVPQTITKVNQNSLIEILISLRKSGKLGEMPSELQSDMNSKRTADQENVVPLRFCLDAVDGFDTDTELSHVLTAIIDDPQLSYQDKMIKCQQFRQHHPKVYKKHFSHLRW